MRAACSLLRELSESEWSEYQLNSEINERGVPVDVPLATAALSYITDIKLHADEAILKLTDGEVTSARARKLRDAWVMPRLSESQKALLLVKKGDKETYSFDQEHRDNLLAAKDLDPEVEQLLEHINDAGGSSASKYNVIANQHVDDRIYYSLQWHGAATGRWTSKGLQIHNMPRNAFDDPEPIISDVLEGYEIEKPAKSLSRLLRASITSAKGITWSDWSAIEGRICPWLSDDDEAQAVLDVFRRSEDIYIHTAEGMGMEDRQAGKVAALSMQFAGGAGALMRMAKNFGTIYSEDEAEELKVLWRESNQWAVRFWHGLKNAANKAYRKPGEQITCGKMSFFYDGADFLWMIRPSGLFHAYYQPRIELVEYPWGDSGYELTALAGSVMPKAGAKWPRRALTPGILIENATQGAAADLMRNAVTNSQHLPIILHCHDELVVEGNHVEELHAIMETAPTWAEGLPLKAETTHKQRYGK
jgi:DNA polymerase